MTFGSALAEESVKIGKFLTVKTVAVPNSVRRTYVWQVWGRDDLLGHVSWFGRWRQYTFSPMSSTTFNRSCLTDLSQFLEKVNFEHRRKRKNGTQS